MKLNTDFSKVGPAVVLQLWQDTRSGPERRGMSIGPELYQFTSTDRVGVVTLFLETAIGPYPIMQTARRDAVALPKLQTVNR